MQRLLIRRLVISSLCVMACTPAVADRGLIFIPGVEYVQYTEEEFTREKSKRGPSGPVKFFEPNQNALIAVDGKEEILLLTTDLRSDRPAKVLEVLPLPSEPKITKGDLKTLRTAVAVLNDKIARPVVASVVPYNPGTKALYHMQVLPPAAVVVSHEQIGTHEVSVVKVLDPAKFASWTEENLKRLGSTSPSVPAWMKAKIKKYTESGFHWFAFDVVELNSKLKTVEPLRYRFATKKLFYPLQITKVEGPSKVKLLVMTTRPIGTIDPIQGAKITRASKAFPLHKTELDRIDPEMKALLDKSPSFDRPLIQMFELNNPDGKDYQKDLIARFQ